MLSDFFWTLAQHNQSSNATSPLNPSKPSANFAQTMHFTYSKRPVLPESQHVANTDTCTLCQQWASTRTLQKILKPRSHGTHLSLLHPCTLTTISKARSPSALMR